MSDDVLKRIRDAYAEFASMPPPRTDPIKLTQEQFDSLKAMLLQQPRPAWFTDTATVAMHGVPVVVVDSTVESTPYLEGWIKCPSCGKPAVGHGEVLCDRVLVFGPFGDFVVRRPRSFFGADSGFERGVDAMIGFQRDQQRLLSDPGFTPGDLLRIKAGLFALAADGDEELASAIARWDNDGGCCA